MLDQALADTEIEQLCRAGDYGTATTRVLSRYQAEIFAFLEMRLRNHGDAEDAFAIFAEHVWRGLGGFQFRCSLRGWLYVVARNAANRAMNRPDRGARKAVHGGEGSMPDFAMPVRTVTAPHLRTDVKDSIRALREQLPVEDQTLLVLHVDRKLPWREIALVMTADSEGKDDAALEREVVRLRKRFERVKGELRALALKAGLLPR